MWYIVGRRCERHLWLSSTAVEVFHACYATRRGWREAAARLFDGDPGRRGDIIHHSDGNTRDRSVTWSTVADVARPPLAVFLRGDESGVQRRTWRGPRALWSGPDLMISLCQMVVGVAAALQRRVPHDGGLLGAVQSASSGSLSAWGHAWLRRLYVREAASGCSGLAWSLSLQPGCIQFSRVLLSRVSSRVAWLR